jgi:hypothetical protein
MTVGTAKGKGGASEQRQPRQHGSAARRGMAKWGGQLQRLGEKPKGSRGPGKGR